MIFETERLIIRQLHKDDIMMFHDLQHNFNVMQYATGKAQTYEENVADLNHVIGCYDKPENTFWVWAIDRKSDEEFIGTVAIILTKDNENDIGYRIREKHWKNGYGREVANGIIEYAFSELKMDSVVGVADVKNTASIRILEQTMDFVDEAYNPELDCVDRSYKLDRDRMKSGKN